MASNGGAEQVPATRADVTAPAYIVATSGFVTWTLNRVVFGDESGAAMPPEVFVWVQLTVPMAMAWAASEWRLRRARRRPRGLPPPAP